MNNSPQAVDQYSRVMVDLFDERDVIGVSTGFQSLFGNPATSSKTLFSPDSSVVDIDIIRGNEKTAAMILRGSEPTRALNAKSASDQKYTNQSRVYPLGEETSIITAEQLNNRMAGENPYARRTKLDRVRLLAFNNHKEHIRRFVRMFERLASQSALTGIMDGIIGTANSNLKYDFKRSATNTITTANKWDAGGATIMADIDALCDKIRENGKVSADMGVVGGQTMEAMLSDATFQGKADNRRFELINISSNVSVPPKYKRYVDAGFNPRGLLRTAKGYELWLFTYVDGFEDEGGTFTKYMPEDEMLILATSARADRYFGPSEQMPMEGERLAMISRSFGLQSPETLALPEIKGGAVINPAMFYYDAYATGDHKGVISRTQTAPIFATTMTDGFGLLNGLVTL